ncbi:MAG: hypothetical protein ACRCRT_04160 [Cetobacterium somerae]
MIDTYMTIAERLRMNGIDNWDLIAVELLKIEIDLVDVGAYTINRIKKKIEEKYEYKEGK